MTFKNLKSATILCSPVLDEQSWPKESEILGGFGQGAIEGGMTELIDLTGGEYWKDPFQVEEDCRRLDGGVGLTVNY